MLKLIITLIYFTNPVVECDKRFIIDTEQCKIRDFDPYEPWMSEHFDEYPIYANCNQGRPPLVGSNLTSIYFIEESMRFYGMLPEDDIPSCRYTPFYRIPPVPGWKDKRILFGSTVYFINSANVEEHEFVLVECFYKNEHVYRDFFAFVPLKNGFEKKINNDGSFNVLMLGFDGTSRLNFYRHMPRTRKVLQALGGHELFGYNKVGGKSFPNLIPLLTGLSVEQLKKDCWPTDTTYFDDCQFIWDDFQTQQYVTAYGDDIWSINNFRSSRRGFGRKQKNDYDIDYFVYMAEKQISNGYHVSVGDCLGARDVYKVLLEYIEKFVNKMDTNNLKFFGYFFDTIMSHDDIARIKLADETVANFFNGSVIRNVLNNTILIFFSDHGSRFSSFRSTYQGSVEDRLPIIYFYFPDSFKNKYEDLYHNFLINRYRLTTPFDVYKTLLILSGLRNDLTERAYPNINKQHLYSLFNNIPESRTCDDAQIPFEYCSCYDSREIPEKQPLVEDISKFVIDYMNKIVPEKCAELALETVLSARSLDIQRFQKRNGSGIFFVVTFQTTPGNGLFEATVNIASNKSNENKMVYKLMGDISRINMYGMQSACLGDNTFKHICYCKK